MIHLKKLDSLSDELIRFDAGLKLKNISLKERQFDQLLKSSRDQCIADLEALQNKVTEADEKLKQTQQAANTNCELSQLKELIDTTSKSLSSNPVKTPNIQIKAPVNPRVAIAKKTNQALKLMTFFEFDSELDVSDSLLNGHIKSGGPSLNKLRKRGNFEAKESVFTADILWDEIYEHTKNLQ
eukprot:GHVL01035903.1.p1 GENE.GHVL01035903.1~~GHVL01035903.1.p1  ORF type:complete len:183 (+),score=43.89 GHVL01035903.1:639-1187(+)